MTLLLGGTSADQACYWAAPAIELRVPMSCSEAMCPSELVCTDLQPVGAGNAIEGPCGLEIVVGVGVGARRSGFGEPVGDVVVELPPGELHVHQLVTNSRFLGDHRRLWGGYVGGGVVPEHRTGIPGFTRPPRTPKGEKPVGLRYESPLRLEPSRGSRSPGTSLPGRPPSAEPTRPTSAGSFGPHRRYLCAAWLAGKGCVGNLVEHHLFEVMLNRPGGSRLGRQAGFEAKSLRGLRATFVPLARNTDECEVGQGVIERTA
jgi:hypothetical protein